MELSHYESIIAPRYKVKVETDRVDTEIKQVDIDLPRTIEGKNKTKKMAQNVKKLMRQTKSQLNTKPRGAVIMIASVTCEIAIYVTMKMTTLTETLL